MQRSEFDFDADDFFEAAEHVRWAVDRIEETRPQTEQAYKEIQKVAQSVALYSTPFPYDPQTSTVMAIDPDRLFGPLFQAQRSILKAVESLTAAAREITVAEKTLYYGVIMNDGTDEPTDESEAKQ